MKKVSKSYYFLLEDIMRCYAVQEFSNFDICDQLELAQAYLDHDKREEKDEALEILQEIASDSVREYVGYLAQGNTKAAGDYLLNKFRTCRWLADKINFDIDMINARPDHDDSEE
jgi:hypothetical protein